MASFSPQSSFSSFSSMVRSLLRLHQLSTRLFRQPMIDLLIERRQEMEIMIVMTQKKSLMCAITTEVRGLG